tara:strand:+ start:521 stop:748 length:228 start_codon:yes stop_codon:yes gene_type:complete
MMNNLIATAIAAALLMSTGTATAQYGSNPVREVQKFYSDPGMTNQTGLFVFYCDGTTYRWGKIDIHGTIETYDCP